MAFCLVCSSCYQTGRGSPQLGLTSASCSLCKLLLYQTGRCSPQLELGLCGKPPMAFPFSEDGVQRVSLSPSDSGLDPDDMEPCADPLPMEIDERPLGFGSYEVRFPADTPVTPPAIGLSHAQWCDKINGQGRECFDLAPFHDSWLAIPLHDSILILPSHMRPMERLDSPSGRRSSATFSRSVLT